MYPLTPPGQLTIICYATIGIPLYLITTAKISFMLAAIFAFFYKYTILVPISLVAKLLPKQKKSTQKKPKSKDEENDAFGKKQYFIEKIIYLA